MQFVNVDNLLNDNTVFSYTQAEKAYKMIKDAYPEKDVKLKYLFTDMIEKAVHYTEYRLKWSLASMQERMAMDEERSRCHNLFIAALNRLSVYMYENKYDNSWEDLIGSDRKRIGDFACYIAYIYSVDAR